MILKKLLTNGICATVLSFATPANADFISGEVFGSDKGALLEVKGSAHVGEDTNVQYFTRVRRFRGYDGTNTSFMQNELSVGDLNGVRVVGQGRLVGEKLVPQAGVSWLGKSENGSFYAALTSSVQKDTIGELLMFGTVKLGEKTLLELEQIVSANTDVLKASSRGHIGYSFGNFSLGAAGEVDYGQGIATTPKVGLYVRLRSK